MESPSGRYVMAFNGEIYNYKELAENVLGNAPLAKFGDSRVLLELLDRKGLSSVCELNGMFAILLFDRKEKKLSLIRDRFGVKPLHFGTKNNRWYVASEIKGLFEQIEPEIDPEILQQYLDFGTYTPGKETFYKKIYQVVPGSILTFSAEGQTEERYFNLANEIRKWQEKRPTTQEFESLLSDSIRIRLRSDIPIDLHYSGGTDSTAILLKTKEVWGWDYPIETFTISYSEEEVDESKFASSYCEKLGILNHRVLLSAYELPALAQELQNFEDEPFGGVPMVAYLKSNRIQKEKGFTVAIEGQGGDEALGGYPSHLLLATYDLIESESNAVLLRSLLTLLRMSREEVIQKAEEFIQAGFASQSDLTDLRQGLPSRERQLDSWLLSIQMYDALQNKIPRVLKFEDRASMAASREVRFPLLDYRVMGCGMALTHEQKFNGGESKAPLLGIIKKYLGNSFSTTKRSVVSPQTLWLRGVLRPWVEENLIELRDRQVVDSKYFSKVHSLLEAPKIDNSFFIWQMVNLNLMYRAIAHKSL